MTNPRPAGYGFGQSRAWPWTSIAELRHLPISPKLMRIVYFDEAGIASEAQEPITVVAGVIVDADRHWLLLEQQIALLLSEYIPVEDRKNFEFHAKNLFSGSVYLNKHMGRAKRHELLSRFASLLPTNDIPVLYGAIDRAGLRRANSAMIGGGRELGICFLVAMAKTEIWFQDNAPQEVGLCIADETKTKAPLKSLMRQFRNEPLVEEIVQSQFHHLIDTISFNGSEESLGLQLADVASFLIKRHLMGKADSEPFFKIIEPQVVWGTTMFAEK